MRTRQFNSEVLYADEPVVKVDGDVVRSLICGASENQRRRLRLCTHQDVDDELHEMFIVHERDAYVRPHQHLGGVESFHIIEGEVDVVLFDERGAIDDVISMGEYRSGKCFYYRIADEQFHTLLIRSPILVFHETTDGPFLPEKTSFAPFAPDESDRIAVERFIAETKRKVEQFLGDASTGKHIRSEAA